MRIDKSPVASALLRPVSVSSYTIERKLISLSGDDCIGHMTGAAALVGSHPLRSFKSFTLHCDEDDVLLHAQQRRDAVIEDTNLGSFSTVIRNDGSMFCRTSYNPRENLGTYHRIGQVVRGEVDISIDNINLIRSIPEERLRMFGANLLNDLSQ